MATVAAMFETDGRAPYVLTYLHDAPRAIVTAKLKGSCLTTGLTDESTHTDLMKDLAYVGSQVQLLDTFSVNTRTPDPDLEIVQAKIKEANGYFEENDNPLVIIGNLDYFIGTSDEEPTPAQLFALTAFSKWLGGESRHKKPEVNALKVCAVMRQPELATHRLRQNLVATFAARHVLAEIA